MKYQVQRGMKYYVSLVDCLLIFLSLYNSTGAMAGQALGKGILVSEEGIERTQVWTCHGNPVIEPIQSAGPSDSSQSTVPVNSELDNVMDQRRHDIIQNLLSGHLSTGQPIQESTTMQVPDGGTALNHLPDKQHAAVNQSAGPSDSSQSTVPLTRALDKTMDNHLEKAAGGNSDKSTSPVGGTAETHMSAKQEDAVNQPSIRTGGFNVVKTMGSVYMRLSDDGLGDKVFETRIGPKDYVQNCSVKQYFEHTAIRHCCCIWPPRADLNYLADILLDDINNFLDKLKTDVRDHDIITRLRLWSCLTYLWSKDPQTPRPRTIGLSDDEDLKCMFHLKSQWDLMPTITVSGGVLPTVPDVDLPSDAVRLVEAMLVVVRRVRTIHKSAGPSDSSQSTVPVTGALDKTMDKRRHDIIQNLLLGRLSTSQPIQTAGVNVKTGGVNVVNTMGTVYMRLLRDGLGSTTYESIHRKTVKLFFEHTATSHCCVIWPPQVSLNFLAGKLLDEMDELLHQQRSAVRDQSIVSRLRIWNSLTVRWFEFIDSKDPLPTSSSFVDPDHYWFFQLHSLWVKLHENRNAEFALPAVPDEYHNTGTLLLARAIVDVGKEHARDKQR
eukprot:GHVQ01016814.1.p1 GENE.GHVQ01016814.1~~GHVQ01016814.1.p1  ORF type:complete len:607 (-),score=58.98 GHVQ01016814.1:164-1984(-)